jgi:hypothetical protein
MFSIYLSWTVGSGSDCCGGNKKTDSWNDIYLTLEKVLSHSGTVTLDIINAPEIGPQSLQVQSDGGFSVLFLGENSSEDYEVRTFNGSPREAEQTFILGNIWNSNLICADSEVIVKIFHDFFELGDVSHDLLN